LVQEVGGCSSSNPLSAAAKRCFTQVASESKGRLASAVHPSRPMYANGKAVTTTSRPDNSFVKEVQGLAKAGEMAPWMTLAWLGSMGRSAKSRRDRKRRAPNKEDGAKRMKLSAKAASQKAAGNALAQHIQAEQAAVDAATNNDRGRLTQVRCPMLVRHLRDQRVIIVAAEVEQQQQQQLQHQQQQPPEPQSPSATTTTDGTSESSVFETKLADLAAQLRATPRLERRRLLMELPKGTRNSLEAFLLAGRKVSEPAHCAESVASPGGEVPQSATCGQPATAKVEDARA